MKNHSGAAQTQFLSMMLHLHPTLNMYQNKHREIMCFVMQSDAVGSCPTAVFSERVDDISQTQGDNDSDMLKSSAGFVLYSGAFQVGLAILLQTL